VVATGSGGCPVEQIGWPTPLHSIRGDEKLTAGGVTLFDGDVIRILEDVLPGRFGGRPADYQRVEDHAAKGSPRLRLLVAPAGGAVDEAAVAETLRFLLAAGSAGGGVMGRPWRDARLPGGERRSLFATVSGKILSLHLER
jgi:hypothetical protein